MIDPRGNPDVPPSWPAPPGTVHKWCEGCSHWFASRGTEMCPTCTMGTSNRANLRRGDLRRTRKAER
jgi:hypothetical protein